MGAPNGIERRDPASGLLRLGARLARAGRLGETGELRIEDQGRVHHIRLLNGIISEVVFEGENSTDGSALPVRYRAARMFDLPRPLVRFIDDTGAKGHSLAAPSEQVVLVGMLRRRDLFEPRPLIERIPVDVLRLNDDSHHRLRALSLTQEERQFIHALMTPTPTTLALWKRGLEPRHAAAMVMALNLLECFDDWRAGDLPRRSRAAAIERKIRNAAPDYDILGVSESADPRELDRAFRRLSFIYHPDRRQDLPEHERAAATRAFRGIAEAHARLKSRRARPVHHTSGRPWLDALEKAKAAVREGNLRQAKAQALKALAAAPPPNVIAELKALLRRVA